MSENEAEVSSRMAGENPEQGEPSYTMPTSRHRFNKKQRYDPQGESKETARLSREMAAMAENMRSINQQNQAMHEMLMNMQAQGGYPNPQNPMQEEGFYQNNQYDGIDNHMGGQPPYQHENPLGGEAEVGSSTNQAGELP